MALLDVERARRDEAEEERLAAVEAANQQVLSAEQARDEAEARAKEQLAKVAKAAIGQTKKGRSRVRRALAKFGLDLEDLLGGATLVAEGTAEDDDERD